MKNFLANEWDRAQTVKRGGALKIISWDEHAAENQFIAEPATIVSPEDAFEKRWAGVLLEQVLHRLREEFAATGKTEAFNALKEFLWCADSSVSYAELSAQLRLSEGAARVAVHRFRQRYRELLRTGIANAVADHLWRSNFLSREFQHCYRLPRGLMSGFGREKQRAYLDTTTGTQPSGCLGVSIAPCCSVNAAFLFAEPRLVVVVSKCAKKAKAHRK